MESQEKHGFLPLISFRLTDDWNAEETRRCNEVDEKDIEIFSKFKNSARYGLPMKIRRNAWFVASGGKDFVKSCNCENLYKLATNYSNMKNRKDNSDNLFGTLFPLSLFSLPDSVSSELKNFLSVLWANNSDITFAPLVPTVSFLLLMFLEPDLAYISIQAMINRSKKDSWYFTLDKYHFFASIAAFEVLAKNKISKVYKKANELGIEFSSFVMPLFHFFFLPFMPLPVVMTMFDSFVIEGRKILVRFLINLLKICEKKLLIAKTKNEFICEILKAMNEISSTAKLKIFLKDSFEIQLQRKKHMIEIENEVLNHKDKLNSIDCSINRDLIDASLEINGEHPLKFPRSKSSDKIDSISKQLSPSPIIGKLLTPKLYDFLKQHFPKMYCNHSLQIVFDIENDGTSYSGLLSSMKTRSPYLLIIKTTDHVFGAYFNENPYLSKNKGNRTCFVYDAINFKVYKPLKKTNLNFFNINKSFFCVGGPEPAIIFDNRVFIAQSNHCETYDSPSFTTKEFGEEISQLEIYKFVR